MMLPQPLQASLTVRSSRVRPSSTRVPVLTTRTPVPFQTGWSARRNKEPRKAPQKTPTMHQKWLITCHKRSSFRPPRLKVWTSLNCRPKRALVTPLQRIRLLDRPSLLLLLPRPRVRARCLPALRWRLSRSKASCSQSLISSTVACQWMRSGPGSKVRKARSPPPRRQPQSHLRISSRKEI